MMHDDQRSVLMSPADLTFGDLVAGVWAYRIAIAGTAVVAAIAALLLSMLLPKQYEAQATLMVVPSRVPNATGEASGTDAQTQYYLQAYGELLRSRGIATTVGTALGLDKPPYELTGEDLAKRFSITNVVGTPLLRVALELPDAALATKAVDAQTREAITRAEQMVSSDLLGTRKYLASQVEDARKELGERAARLEAARARLGVDGVKKQLDDLLAQRGEVDAEAGRAARDTAEHGARANNLEATLSKQPRVLTLKRSVGLGEPALGDAAAALTNKSRSEVATLAMQSEEQNPVLTEGEPLMVVAKANEAGARAKERYLREQLRQIDARVARLQSDLAARSREFASVERDYLLAQTAYETFSKSYENARLTVAAQAPSLQVLEAAQANARPTSPKPALNAVVAGLVSGLFAVLAVVLAVYIRRDRHAVAG